MTDHQQGQPCAICADPALRGGSVCNDCMDDAALGLKVRGTVVVTPPACEVCAEEGDYPSARALLFRDGRISATVFACGHWQDEPVDPPVVPPFYGGPIPAGF